MVDWPEVPPIGKDLAQTGPVVMAGVLGLAMFNLSMAIFQNLIISLLIAVIVTIVFPMVYVDRSPRCVYCFGTISAGAQFCAHCGRIQPESG